MGLDMYLYRKDKGKYDYDDEIGYWRKANAIHGWMVENVQGGVDDCGVYNFPLQKIVELYFLCREVLKNPSKCKDLLPVTQGCFFGSYEYDEWYFEYIKDTRDILESVLLQSQLEYQYQSSW